MSGGGAEKSLECSICFNYFKLPKKLPCQHTFCLHCLKDYCNWNAIGDKKNCPICSREFTVPRGGVEMLPDNQVLMRTALEKGTRKRKLESFGCELCEEVGDQVAARGFCMECKQCLCKRCDKMHARQNATKLHRVVTLDQKPSAEDLTRMQSAYCTKHDGEELKLYCSECSELLCYSCHATAHYKHKCVTSLEAAKSRKISMYKDYESIEKCREDEKQVQRST